MTARGSRTPWIVVAGLGVAIALVALRLGIGGAGGAADEDPPADGAGAGAWERVVVVVEGPGSREGTVYVRPTSLTDDEVADVHRLEPPGAVRHELANGVASLEVARGGVGEVLVVGAEGWRRVLAPGGERRVVQLGEGAVHGVAHDPVSGRALAGTPVVLEAAWAEGSPFHSVVRTDAAGRFAFGRLQRGNYVVRLAAERSDDTIHVRAGQTSVCDLHPPAETTWRGRIRLLDGTPLEERVRMGMQGRDLRTRHLETDTTGAFEIGIPAGGYSVFVLPQRFGLMKPTFEPGPQDRDLVLDGTLVRVSLHESVRQETATLRMVGNRELPFDGTREMLVFTRGQRTGRFELRADGVEVDVREVELGTEALVELTVGGPR